MYSIVLWKEQVFLMGWKSFWASFPLPHFLPCPYNTNPQVSAQYGF
jgi:hypothetical protein